MLNIFRISILWQLFLIRLSVCQDVWFLVVAEKNQTEMVNRFSAGLSRIQNGSSSLRFNFLKMDYDQSNEEASLAAFCNMVASRYVFLPKGSKEWVLFEPLNFQKCAKINFRLCMYLLIHVLCKYQYVFFSKSGIRTMDFRNLKVWT